MLPHHHPNPLLGSCRSRCSQSSCRKSVWWGQATRHRVKQGQATQGRRWPLTPSLLSTATVTVGQGQGPLSQGQATPTQPRPHPLPLASTTTAPRPTFLWVQPSSWRTSPPVPSSQPAPMEEGTPGSTTRPGLPSRCQPRGLLPHPLRSPSA